MGRSSAAALPDWRWRGGKGVIAGAGLFVRRWRREVANEHLQSEFTGVAADIFAGGGGGIGGGGAADYDGADAGCCGAAAEAGFPSWRDHDQRERESAGAMRSFAKSNRGDHAAGRAIFGLADG